LEAALRNPDKFSSLLLVSGVYPSESVPPTEYHKKLRLLLPTLSRNRKACVLYCKTIYGSDDTNLHRGSGSLERARLNHLLSQAFHAPQSLYHYAHYDHQFWGEKKLGATGKRHGAAAALRDKVRF